MKRLYMFLSLLPGAVFAAAPQVTSSTVSVDAYGDVTVSYTVDSDAIVTMDFSYDGELVDPAKLVKISGDINVPVTSGRTWTFRWLASLDMPGVVSGGNKLAVRLQAWTPSDPPDYAVVELLTNAAHKVRYYASVDHLPGGLLSNPAYRMTKMPFRRIHATGVTWQMGTLGETGRTAAREKARQVTMDHDYYMAVFEMTKGQCSFLADASNRGDDKFCGDEWYFRPIERTPLSVVRGTNAVPDKTVFMRARLHGVADMDLPSEAEWEYAAKAGFYDNYYNDGSPYEASNTNEYIRALACFNTNETFAVGSLKPNAWGLYDTLGNVSEMCLDFYQDDVSMYFDGKPNVSETLEHRTRDNAVSTANRVSKGGEFSGQYDSVRPGYHRAWAENEHITQYGYRLRFYGPLAK